MKKRQMVLGCLLYLFLLVRPTTAQQNWTEFISCSLPGAGGRIVTFSINNETKEISYYFKKAGKTGLCVKFNENNKLKRLVDNEMGVTYYGFNRGGYGYVINVMNGSEKEEYAMSFDVKKNNLIIQSNDCLPNSFRVGDIKSDYIVEVPYVGNDKIIFP